MSMKEHMNVVSPDGTEDPTKTIGRCFIAYPISDGEQNDDDSIKPLGEIQGVADDVYDLNDKPSHDRVHRSDLKDLASLDLPQKRHTSSVVLD